MERLAIQWGSSIPYPLSASGAHVSAVPNHQTGRMAPLGFRAAVAMFGVFGYELDPAVLSDAERDEVRRQVAFYVERRDLFQRGRFARLRSPFEGTGNEAARTVTSPDGSRAVAAHYRVLYRPLPVRDRLRLRDLDPDARYEVTAWSSFTAPEGSFVRGGDELMRVGIGIEPPDPAPSDAQPPDGIRIVRGDFTFRLSRITASRNAGTASRRTRLIVQPPNPAPVRRAPMTPGWNGRSRRAHPARGC